MNDPTFAAVVSRRLAPVLAPYGFPYEASNNGVDAAGEPAAINSDTALFHCDGPDQVAAVLDNYPEWGHRLREAYGPHDIVCLDLWVRQDDGVRTFEFEGFEADVLAASSAAHRDLERFQDGELDAWVEQLASLLDRYFSTLA